MSRKKKKSSKEFHHKLLTVGKFALLIGGLIAVGLSSAYMGMRFAVRGSEVEVPSIIGKPLEQATETLKKVELKLEVLGERFDPQIGKGAVLSQHPQPGRRIKVQRKVQVILSLGEKRNPVPDLRGSTLRVARLMASQSGFELGHITEISISGVPKEEIVQQFPPPDSKEILSPKIDVLVSRGSSARYVMPDVTGQGLNKVLLLFERNGFKLGKIQYRYYPNVSRGTVVKQFPEPGYSLTDENSINLEIAR